MNIFQKGEDKKKTIVLNVIRIDKISVLSIICDKCGSKDKKIIKEEESIEILKILGLIRNTEYLMNI